MTQEELMKSGAATTIPHFWKLTHSKPLDAILILASRGLMWIIELGSEHFPDDWPLLRLIPDPELLQMN